MSEFEKLDSILVLDLYGDIWNDDYCLLATDILNAFTSADWKELESVWKRKPESWKALLADCLSGASPDKSIGILLDMIETESNKVIEPAVFSLRGFQGKFERTSLTARQKDRIMEVVNMSSFNKSVLGDFAKGLTS